MKKIIVTGATGFLGLNLIKELLADRNNHVLAVLGRHKDKKKLLPTDRHLEITSSEDIFGKKLKNIDTLIHTAFYRKENLQELVSSIEYTKRIIDLVNAQDINSMINISSQGVYKCGHPGEKVDENGEIGPETVYGLSKWAVEQMINLGCKKNFTSVRMASLSANANFLRFFVNCVKNGKDILVTSPFQYASIMDIKDAVEGINSILKIPSEQWDNLYNLGSGTQYSISEYANKANQIGNRLGYSAVNITEEDKGNRFAICTDCSRLTAKTGWIPQITVEKMISDLYKEIQ